MQNLVTTTLALFGTATIFVLVTVKQGFRRWFGLKGFFFAYINEAQHNSTFHIPASIQKDSSGPCSGARY
jgi:hypothetical protein